MKIAISQKCMDVFAPNFALVFRTKLLKCVALCFIYFIYTIMMEAQPLRINFATEQKVGFVEVIQAVNTAFFVTHYVLFTCKTEF